MEEPDVNETAEDQVTESDSSVSEPTKADLMEDAQELDIAGRSSMDKAELGQAVGDAQDEAEAAAELESEPPGARARAEGEAERAQRLAEARHAGEPEEVDTAELVCTVHGGELRPAPGKHRWICDRTQRPGSCVAGYRS